MPRRLRIDLCDIAAWGNLEAALWAAARGKRSRPDVAAFLADAERNLARVGDALLAGRLPDGGCDRFRIHDPKPRIIHAAPFPDRVAQHALMRLMEPVLERALVPTSFACRPGLGVHAALAHAQACARRWPWTLKLDVRHYFPAIPHERLLALLERRIKGSALVLVRHIVEAHGDTPGHGLPIGALTSQHFANQYLGEADRHALALGACRGHLRYMDDIVLWCEDRAAGRALHREMAAFCSERLGLELKPPVLTPSTAGLGLCGMRVYPGTIKLGRRRRRAFRERRRHWEACWRRGEIDDAGLQRAYASLTAMTLPADAREFRRRELARRPAPGAGSPE